MQTTLHIDEDLLRELVARANETGASLPQVVNEVLRRGLQVETADVPTGGQSYKQKTHPLGPANFNVDKALAFSSDIEDEEALRKLRLGK